MDARASQYAGYLFFHERLKVSQKGASCRSVKEILKMQEGRVLLRSHLDPTRLQEMD